MKLLVAEDDVFFQRLLAELLGPEHEIVLACTGDEAWEILQRPDAPQLAILDWVMPGLTGPEICRKVRADERLHSMYLLILTSKNSEADIVAGLRAGADDYITKPPIAAELRARVRVGERVLSLQRAVETQALSNPPVFAGSALRRTSRAEGRKPARKEKSVEARTRISAENPSELSSVSCSAPVSNVHSINFLERFNYKG
jgi:DNA-binding response OmpR family regulator